MSDKPTAEQVAEAREYFLAKGPGDAPRPADVHRHIQTLLAATESPTDEELNREADALDGVGLINAVTIRRVYRAGARREGRQ